MKQELIMEQKIEQARELLRELDQDKRESPFEKARRFLVIQESLIRLKKVGFGN
ncbi:MAG: hypothetical protein PHH54_06635 [Candidatus Nanoarchaeia archaeon]|nr:hypothetical protein [Candidatus Nanoarchaeia archaeon]MDD5741632.1 hypothetical protein [Candidatus Nanoarchaeia archaeon]